MERSLRDNERIEIRGFGSFEIRKYRGYEGRNPRTGEKVEVNAKRLPFFKVGKDLRIRVNGEESDEETGGESEDYSGRPRGIRQRDAVQTSCCTAFYWRDGQQPSPK